jgi:hypothetical protein
MLMKSVAQAYKSKDPNYVRALLAKLPLHLMDKNTEFILLRNSKKELVGIERMTKLGEDHYELGTFYVEKGYDGIGTYMGDCFKKRIPPEARVTGFFLATSEVITRHIEKKGYVGTRVFAIGEGEHETTPLIEMDIRPSDSYSTRNKKGFPLSRIRSLHQEDEEEGIHVILADTSSPDYAAEIRPYLERGWGLTRALPAQESEKDLKYIVLERPALSGKEVLMTG